MQPTDIVPAPLPGFVPVDHTGQYFRTHASRPPAPTQAHTLTRTQNKVGHSDTTGDRSSRHKHNFRLSWVLSVCGAVSRTPSRSCVTGVAQTPSVTANDMPNAPCAPVQPLNAPLGHTALPQALVLGPNIMPCPACVQCGTWGTPADSRASGACRYRRGPLRIETRDDGCLRGYCRLQSRERLSLLPLLLKRCVAL